MKATLPKYSYAPNTEPQLPGLAMPDVIQNENQLAAVSLCTYMENGLTPFWAHRLEDMRSFIEATRP
jgi:hypothetical protein